MIDINDFDKVEVRVGTVVDVKENKKARHPAYAVTRTSASLFSSGLHPAATIIATVSIMAAINFLEFIILL